MLNIILIYFVKLNKKGVEIESKMGRNLNTGTNLIEKKTPEKIRWKYFKRMNSILDFFSSYIPELDMLIQFYM